MRVAIRILFVLAALVALAACDGGEIAVFSASEAGSGGLSGVGGVPSMAGSSASAGELAGGGGSAAAGASGSSGSGGAGGASGTPCRDLNDCPGSGWLCNKTRCADEFGACKPRNIMCDANNAPVCGCDQVTYWNDCLRDQYGVASSSPGQCGPGASACMTSNDCALGASCSHFLSMGTTCDAPPGSGTCWVTPDECSTMDRAHYQICSPPGSGGNGPPPCVTGCQAIQSGRPYLPQPHGACP